VESGIRRGITKLKMRDPVSTDDDDWVGTPPEGHYTRDRAKPEFWRSQKPLLVTGTGIVLALLVLAVVLLTR
jgi:hypothetical protein